MNNYIIFYAIRADGKLARLLSPDAILPFDGRRASNLSYIIARAQEQRNRLRRIHPDIAAFKLFRRGQLERVIYDISMASAAPNQTWTDKVRAAVKKGVID